jgi:hypothetical protein
LLLGGYSSGDFNDVLALDIVPKAYLVALDISNGSVLWTRIWGSSAATELYEIAIDYSRQLLYTAGSVIGSINTQILPAGLRDIFICEHDLGNGTITKYWQLGSGGNDGAYGILVEAAGNLLIAGYSSGSINSTPGYTTANSEAVLIRFNATAGQIQTVFVLTNDGSDGFYSVARDNLTGDIYCAGYVSGWSQSSAFQQIFSGKQDVLLAIFNVNFTLKTMLLAGTGWPENGYRVDYYQSARRLAVAGSFNGKAGIYAYMLPRMSNSSTSVMVTAMTETTSPTLHANSFSNPLLSETAIIFYISLLSINIFFVTGLAIFVYRERRRSKFYQKIAGTGPNNSLFPRLSVVSGNAGFLEPMIADRRPSTPLKFTSAHDNESTAKSNFHTGNLTTTQQTDHITSQRYSPPTVNYE